MMTQSCVACVLTFVGTALKQWYNEVTAGLATRGRDLNIPQHYQSMLREEGCK